MKEHIRKLLEERYFLRDEEGNLLESTLEEMYGRVAHTIARVETKDAAKWEIEFYNLMVSGKFLPSTPTLINAGKSRPGSFSACFVLPVEDSMDGIFDAVKNAALVHKSGGGTGFSFSKLREKGAIVTSTGQKSSGPIEFMKVFNQAMDTVKQGGARRGASMGALRVDHPDIREFIRIKDDGVTLTNFNLSVLIPDAFMQAVIEETNWDLISPASGKVVETVSAKAIWDDIVEHAWSTGEPGLLFEDTINADNPFAERICVTNPCGEIPLLENESCNLGSLNLSRYVLDGKDINWKELVEDTKTAIRFLDDVITANYYPLPQIEEATKATRKTGLGVMGWADTLLMLKIPYDSKEAIEVAKDIMQTIRYAAIEASEQLAVERGIFEKVTVIGKASIKHNATLLCVAPTGTISRIAGCSSGIEPVFAWETHHNLGDLSYTDTHWAWQEYIKYSDYDILKPNYMKTAKEIDPVWHLKHQQVFQSFTDNSVSKTINLPTDYGKSDVDEILWDAWDLDLKGITVYRDNSRANQPLNDNQTSPKVVETAGATIFEDGSAAFAGTSPYRQRGQIAVGVTHKIDTGKGKIYVTVNYDRAQQDAVEVFIRLGPSATAKETELGDWVGRMLSLCLKHGVPIKSIVRQSEKVYGESSFIYMNKFFNSLPQLIAYLMNFTWQETLDLVELEDNFYDPEAGWDETTSGAFGVSDIEEMNEAQLIINAATTKKMDEMEYCYECGTYSRVREGGCFTCVNCADSKCG